VPGVTNSCYPSLCLLSVCPQTGIRSRGWQIPFPLLFPRCVLPWGGQAWAEGKGRLAMSRLRADSRQEKGKMYAATV